MLDSSQPPLVTPGPPKLSNILPPSMSDESKWREELSRQNEKVGANMSSELEHQAILERFGPGVSAILERAKRKRKTRRVEKGETESGREIEQVPGSHGKHFGVQNFISIYPFQVMRPNSPTGSILKGNLALVEINY